jgi:hypothetical protein
MIKYDEFTFYDIDKDKLRSLIKALTKYSTPIGLTFERARFHPSSSWDMEELAQISRLTQLTQLVIYGGREAFNWPVSTWLLFTTLTNLQHFSVASKNNVGLAELLLYFPNLVKTPKIGFSEVDSLAALTNLHSLDLNTSPTSDGNSVEVFEKLKFPERLTALTIGVDPRIGKAGKIALHEKMLARLTGLRHLRWVNPTQACPHPLLPNLENLSMHGSVGPLHFNTNLTGLTFALDSLAQTHELVGLTKLRSLSIHYANIDEITPLMFLKSLKELESLTFFSNCELSADLVCPFLTSTKLTSLYWHCSDAIFSEEISRLTALREFTCFNGANLGWLTHLTNLTSLKSSGGRMTSNSYIEKLTKLKSLTVFSGEGYEDNFNMADLTNVEQLRLNIRISNGKNINGLESLTKLKLMHFDSFQDFDVSFLEKATDLQDLKVPAKKAIGFWNVLTKLTMLRALYIQDPIDEELARNLLPLTRLTSLYIQGNISQDMKKQLERSYYFQCLPKLARE